MGVGDIMNGEKYNYTESDLKIGSFWAIKNISLFFLSSLGFIVNLKAINSNTP